MTGKTVELCAPCDDRKEPGPRWAFVEKRPDASAPARVANETYMLCPLLALSHGAGPGLVLVDADHSILHYEPNSDRLLKTALCLMAGGVKPLAEEETTPAATFASVAVEIAAEKEEDWWAVKDNLFTVVYHVRMARCKDALQPWEDKIAAKLKAKMKPNPEWEEEMNVAWMKSWEETRQEQRAIFKNVLLSYMEEANSG